MASTSSANFEEENYSCDGSSALQILGLRKTCFAYTYDDLILLPGHISTGSGDVSLGTSICRGIRLKLPLLSSPMDTVTEHEMAIGMALQGAIGIIHYNMTVEEQANEVRLVKKYKNGFITDPACLSPNDTIADVDRLKVCSVYLYFTLFLSRKHRDGPPAVKHSLTPDIYNCSDILSESIYLDK